MILITEFMDQQAVAGLQAMFPVHYDPALVDDPQALAASMSGVKALIVRNRTQVTADLLAAAPELECVGRLGVGLDNIDLQACQQAQVTVYPATGANDLSVAEYVLSMALVLLRKLHTCQTAMLAGEWPRQAHVGHELAGLTLGLVGYGNTGQQTAAKGQALGMTTVAFDPLLPASNPAWNTTESLSLEALLQQADVISLHLPLTKNTHHLIKADTLALMKSDGLLINAARGGIVHEADLVQALHKKQLGGAALDVFEQEPLSATAADKFRGLDNLLLTPHIAGVTHESNVRVSQLIADRVMQHLQSP